jgi:hypothetical protein
VVSGNIRRSSEIALGFPEDEAFLELKNAEKYPEVKSHRWASNNRFSVRSARTGKMVKMTAQNGEPGYAWPEVPEVRPPGRPAGLQGQGQGINPWRADALGQRAVLPGRDIPDQAQPPRLAQDLKFATCNKVVTSSSHPPTHHQQHHFRTAAPSMAGVRRCTPAWD